MNLQPYLQLMSEQQASDMYFTTGAPVSVRIEGLMRPVGKSMLNPGMTKKLAYDLLTPAQIKEFERNLELNLGVSYTGLGRFRINIYLQRGEVSMVIRYIQADIPGIDDLGLPEVYKTMVMSKKGLILVVGANGMGKSTSLASMSNRGPPPCGSTRRDREPSRGGRGSGDCRRTRPFRGGSLTR